jgi:hypothetical protein
MSDVIRNPEPSGEALADGVFLHRIQPGGRRGPHDEVLRETPGGQGWAQYFRLGDENDAFHMTIPDIRMPANQHWPLHWHDCWIAVIVLDGSVCIGDWWMQPGDVLISKAGVEYGPLLNGPSGCQLFEIFAQDHLSPGGYAPEYADHPTIQGLGLPIKPRSPLNRRNDGRQVLPMAGVDGLIQTRLEPGGQWDLGSADDPDRGAMRYTALAAGEARAPARYADWHATIVMAGEIRIGDHILPREHMLISRRNSLVDALVSTSDDTRLLDVARTIGGLDPSGA